MVPHHVGILSCSRPLLPVIHLCGMAFFLDGIWYEDVPWKKLRIKDFFTLSETHSYKQLDYELEISMR